MAALARIRSVKLTGGVNVPLEFIMLVFAALPAIVPLLAQGYLRGADYMDTPWRSLELLEALKEGVLFPRWSPDLFYGFGFPIFNFYSPMSFYEVVAMRIIGAPDLLQASKITFALNFLASGIGGYVLARCIGLGRAPAAAAGVLYMYAPSTLRDVYIRSGLASLTGTAFLPFVLTAFVHLCRVRTMTSTAVAALMLSVMILTHNLTSVVALGMIVVIVLVYCWWNHDIRALTPAVLAVALGLGVASFFILPAMTEMPLTHTEKLAAGDLDYRLHFVDPLGEINGTIESRAVDIKYMATRWGAIDLHPAYPYGLPPMKLSLFQGLLVLAFIAALATRRKPSPWIVSSALIAFALFYLHTSWSRWIWESAPLLQAFQFPWRMLEPMGLCVALMGAWGAQSLSRRHETATYAVLSGIAIAAGIWMLPTDLLPFEGGGVQVSRDGLIRHEYRERNRVGTMVDGQFLPLSVQWDEEALQMGDILPRYDATFPPEQWVGQTAFVRPESKAWIMAARRGQLWMEAQLQAGETTKLAFHTVYFAGWTAYVDGKPAAIEPTGWQADSEGRRVALGVLQVSVPAGDHIVRIQFEDTPIRWWSTLLSLASLLVLGSMLVMASRKTIGVRITFIAMAFLLGICLAIRLLLPLVLYTPQWTQHPEVLNLIREAQKVPLEVRMPGGDLSKQAYIQEFAISGEQEGPLRDNQSPARCWNA